MAIFHLSARIISRSKGQNAVAKAAYNARARLYDERNQQTRNYARASGLIFAGIFMPPNSPGWVKDRQKLWNNVEECEKRKDSQLAREIIIALPHELTDEQRRWLVTDFVREQFMRKGMIADVSVHTPGAEGDNRNYHAHILLSMRSISPEGFGKKVREWNSTEFIETWREAWERIQNRYLARFSPGVSVDRRTLAAQEVTDRVPTRHKGAKVMAAERAVEKKKRLKAAFKDEAGKATKKRFTPYQLRPRKAAPQAPPAPTRSGKKGKKKGPSPYPT